jgi:hypothetical protein
MTIPEVLREINSQLAPTEIIGVRYAEFPDEEMECLRRRWTLVTTKGAYPAKVRPIDHFFDRFHCISALRAINSFLDR